MVHLHALRPEYIRDAFPRYKITYMSLVPIVLKSLERGQRARFDALPPHGKFILNRLAGLNRVLTRRRPHLKLSRILLRQVNQAFGGELRALFAGGAFMEPSTLQFFYDLGIPVANGYGRMEAGTAITLNDFNPFWADTVGKPRPGMELRFVSPDAEGIGEVAVRSKTVMSHYLDNPELTSETIQDSWLMTGDLGRLDRVGHLRLFGRVRNMIVTERGKNVIEYVGWGPIGRIGLLRNLHTLYDGSHLNHSLASRRAVKRVDFYLDGPVDVMVDGEVVMLHCQTIEVLPSALNVMV